MDFHSLPRRELQALCKGNRIPANTTNVAMADALHSLKSEGRLIEDSQETMQGSPEYTLAGSVRKASARRVVGASVEPLEQPASPLPRARRVTIKASEMRRLVSEGEGDEEEEKNEDLVAITTLVPVVKRSTAKKPAARSSRRGPSKKENNETSEDGPLEVAKTPAIINGRRTAARRGVEAPAMEQQDEQGPLFSPRNSTRRTRQTSNSIAVNDLTTSTVRRSTRFRARTSVPEMEILIPEPEQEEEGVGDKDSSEKTLDLEAGNVSGLKEMKGGEYEITANNCEKDCDLVVADAVDVVKEDGAPAETTEIVAPNKVELGVDINIPIERAVATDEKPSNLQEEIGGSDEKDSQEGIGESDEKLSDLQEEITKEIEDFEEDSNSVLENAILPQNQLANDAKEDGMIQENEGIDELVAEVEECSEVPKEGITQEIEYCVQEDSHGIINSAILPQHQLAVDAKEDGNLLVEELEASTAKSPSDNCDVIASESKNEESDAVMKNDSSTGFAMAGAAYGEMKVENDAEKESKKGLDVDYNLMSLRKLRTIYKEKLIEKKVEGRRLPLAEINDNQC